MTREEREQMDRIEGSLKTLLGRPEPGDFPGGKVAVRIPPATTPEVHLNGDEATYQAFKARLIADAETDEQILRVLARRPELVISIERHTLDVDGASTLGRIGRLIAGGFFDAGATNSATRIELKRTGSDVNNANIAKVLAELVAKGFLTREGDSFRKAEGAKVRTVQA